MDGGKKRAQSFIQLLAIILWAKSVHNHIAYAWFMCICMYVCVLEIVPIWANTLQPVNNKMANSCSWCQLFLLFSDGQQHKNLPMAG